MQSGLSKEDLKIKEKMVFDRAMNSLSEYHWKDFKYDGFTANTQLILVGEDGLLLTDYDHVLACLKSPIRDLHKNLDGIQTNGWSYRSSFKQRCFCKV